jgi:hypothetical protein
LKAQIYSGYKSKTMIFLLLAASGVDMAAFGINSNDVLFQNT